MRITILTLFPGMFTGFLSESIIKRAIEAGKIEINIINIRDFTSDKHHTTDQPPYGGGPGMIMMIEPIHRALDSLSPLSKGRTQEELAVKNSKTVLLSAKGKLFTQSLAKEYSQLEEITLICGHYEGVDERVAEHLIDEEVRIGDYVLTGGELPSMVMADSIIRLLPGVLGDDESSADESHKTPGYLEYPQYTRPAEYNGWKVPEVLLNGNHKEIDEWRKEKATFAPPA
ncbi:tRNA (guanosine(37)-N1)-methyltransferase TrmD [Candidatus Cerribacteria bacterium 'Amazon FNV 2010 28 9']|uniref:tRNA (guanine-N(1)-)-methyltransferase n=1 Tax=Candidatus Cerribacteria bacterium 'Amazon FNV 2010 28 9' TaxID=2081795 RepID=A0A317JPS8_9BACT|nr:MAG: tRNA (guanosine(37)-N1)-methyltransferase TrmD [Candidatus Cerribacteria bacterium 'Amazon FNV 2010 28 9']